MAIGPAMLRWIERLLTAVGIGSLLWAGAISASAMRYQIEHTVAVGRADPVAPPVDASAPIGRLTIPRLGLSAVVAEGDDDDTLRKAVGHLPDTPFPWQDGNSALAGHRDTFFRPLRRVQVGDAIQFESAQGTYQYRVTRHMVVDPEDVWVLDASSAAALTLITCYPFEFLGAAPRRFVVHAVRVQ